MPKMASTMGCASALVFLGLTLLVSPIVSLGIHSSSFRPDIRERSNPSMVGDSIIPMVERNKEMGLLSRRRILKSVLVAATTTGATALLPMPARAETKKSNFNYELGNGECQTSCVLKCELQATNNKKNDSDCIDACVRSGQRYCHQTTSSKSSPSAEEATSSRYVTTTMEPTIKSSKAIPGLLYNSNRGGAWRD